MDDKAPDWPKFYTLLGRHASNCSLPDMGEDDAVDLQQLARLNIRVQREREWFTRTYAKVQTGLQSRRRQLILVEAQCRMRFDDLLANNPIVKRIKRAEERRALANNLCKQHHATAALIKSEISDWEVALETVNTYIKTCETAKQVIGRVQQAILAANELG